VGIWIFNKSRVSMIDYNKPTAMMLGRWQPWHQGHQMLFEKTLEKTGQVIIMVRDTPRDDSNPFGFEDSKEKNRTSFN
jgi:nicotinamide mononucleotide adenylyltransferase